MGGVGSEYDPRITKEALSDPAVLLPLLGLVLPNVRVGSAQFGIRQGLGQAGQIYDFLRTRGAQEAEAKRIGGLFEQWRNVPGAPTGVTQERVQAAPAEFIPGGAPYEEAVSPITPPTLRERVARIPTQPLPSFSEVLASAPDRYRLRALLAPSASGGIAPAGLYESLTKSGQSWLDQLKNQVLREAMVRFSASKDDKDAESAFLQLAPTAEAAGLMKDQRTVRLMQEFASIHGRDVPGADILVRAGLGADVVRFALTKNETVRQANTKIDALANLKVLGPEEVAFWKKLAAMGVSAPDALLQSATQRKDTERVLEDPRFLGPLTALMTGTPLPQSVFAPLFQEHPWIREWVITLEDRALGRQQQRDSLALTARSVATGEGRLAIEEKRERDTMYVRSINTLSALHTRLVGEYQAISGALPPGVTEAMRGQRLRDKMTEIEQVGKTMETAAFANLQQQDPATMLQMTKFQVQGYLQAVKGQIGKVPATQVAETLTLADQMIQKEIPWVRAALGEAGVQELLDLRRQTQLLREQAAQTQPSRRLFSMPDIPIDLLDLPPALKEPGLLLP